MNKSVIYYRYMEVLMDLLSIIVIAIWIFSIFCLFIFYKKISFIKKQRIIMQEYKESLRQKKEAHKAMIHQTNIVCLDSYKRNKNKLKA